MAKSERDVLAQCLRAIEQGQETPAECLARYPEYRDELAPLLETAFILRAAPDVAPRAPFRQTARRRLLDQLSTRRPVTFWGRIAAGWQPGLGSIWLRRSARVLVWIWVISMVLFGGSRVVSASGGALPGDMLYSVKVAVENVRLALAGDEAAFRLYLEFAGARVHEMEYLATAERFEDMPAAANRLERQLQGAADSVDEVDTRDAARSRALSEELKLSVSAHRGRLEELLGVTPASVRPVIEHVLEVAVDDSENEADHGPGENSDAEDEVDDSHDADARPEDGSDDGLDADAGPEDESDDGPDAGADSEDKADDGRDVDAEPEDEADDGRDADAELKDEADDGPGVDADSEYKADDGRDADADSEAKADDGRGADADSEDKADDGRDADAEPEDEADDGPGADADSQDKADDGRDEDSGSGDERDDSRSESEDRPGHGADDEPHSQGDADDEPDDDSKDDSSAGDAPSADDSSGSDDRPEHGAEGNSNDDDH